MKNYFMSQHIQETRNSEQDCTKCQLRELQCQFGLPGGKLGEPFLGGGERGLFLAKRETNLRSAIAGIIVKAGAWDDGDADFLH